MLDYSINSQVDVNIYNYSPAGLLGRVVDGPRAIIRQREISWKPSQAPDFYLNKTWQAIVLHYDAAHEQLELSLRLVERDPWKEAEVNYPPGREVEGQVVGLIEGAAFIELEPGVDAFLPLSELPVGADQRIENWLWLNDRVRACVVEVAAAKRRMRVSLNSALARRANKMRRQLWSANAETAAEGVTLAEYLPKDTRLRLLRMTVSEDSPIIKPMLNVLLIEDDEAFESGIQSLLQSNGCQVFSKSDGEKGLEFVKNQQKPFDLIITDWNLPGLKGHEIIRQLKKDGNSSRTVMIMDPVLLNQSPFFETLEKDEFDILSKTDGNRLKVNLLSILRELREIRSIPKNDPPQDHDPQDNNKNRHYQLVDNNISFPIVAHPAAADETILTGQSYQERLQALLEQLGHEIQACTVALLRMDPGRSLPVTEACSGQPFSLEQASPDIIYSPIGDVLLKNQEIRIDALTNSTHLERLRALAPFQGFLGMPLPVVEASSYGLILLKDESGFTQQERDQASTAANLLATIIQERRMIQIFQPWQAQNLVGQISSSIIHEVDNKLGGIELLVSTLQDSLKEISRWPEKAEDASFLRQMEQDLEGIAAAQKSASELRDWYLGLTTTDEVQMMDLKKVAREMVRALKSQAQENNIFLTLKSSKHVARVLGRPSQLQQVFLNLILNAIQQMAELHRAGNLAVELSRAENSALPIQVRFKDEGPGVHKQQQERIFDFGFSTRKNGAGLGLTISRQIVTSLKGRLLVEESNVFWGSTFLLELPDGE